MRISVLPKTSLGRWSLWLFLACVLVFVIGVVLGAFILSETIGQLAANIVGPVGILLGIGSFVAGLLGIIKSKERSILIFLVLIIEVLFLVIIVGELIMPSF